jgi:hypothetical protein
MLRRRRHSASAQATGHDSRSLAADGRQLPDEICLQYQRRLSGFPEQHTSNRKWAESGFEVTATPSAQRRNRRRAADEELDSLDNSDLDQTESAGSRRAGRD